MRWMSYLATFNFFYAQSFFIFIIFTIIIISIIITLLLQL